MELTVCSVFAAAFLIKYKDYELQQALKTIKRKCGKPNPNFVLQLEQFALVTMTQKNKKAKQGDVESSANRLMTGQTNIMGFEAKKPPRPDLNAGVL